MPDHSANPADGKLSECERCREYDRPCPQGCAPVVEPQQPSTCVACGRGQAGDVHACEPQHEFTEQGQGVGPLLDREPQRVTPAEYRQRMSFIDGLWELVDMEDTDE